MGNKTVAWLQNHTVATKTLIWDHRSYTYLIIEAEIEGLPHYAGYPDGKILFVSISVPVKYRYYILLHEIEEWQSRHLRGRCLKASESEAIFFAGDHQNTNDRLAYWNFRVEFFRNLIAYEERTNPTSQRTEGFRLSLSLFEGLQGRD